MTTDRSITDPTTPREFEVHARANDALHVDGASRETAPISADEVVTEPVPAGEPENTNSLFSRLGLSVDLGDEAAPAAGVDAPATRPAAHEPATGHAGDHDEDAEVAEYMRKLLGRMRGDEPEHTGRPSHKSGSATRATTKPASGQRTATSTKASSHSATAKPTVTTPAPIERKPRPPRPATPPEASIDLAALRDVANVSARGALDAHSRRQLLKVTFSKLLLAGLALAAGISMAWHSPVLGTYAVVGAGVCWTITLVWGAQYLCLLRICYGSGSRTTPKPASQDEPQASQCTAADAT
ncbi:MAG: hypothetical protein R3C10_01025 [Pirellulales bacterium]